MTWSRFQAARKPMYPTKCTLLTIIGSLVSLGVAASPAAAQQKPNIIFIMGDDIGWSNIGVYNQGIMAGRTPNLDKLAAEGMRFTDYYAEASCTAGRASARASQAGTCVSASNSTISRAP